MKVSVALAAYNGGRHLKHQLDSIAQQDRPPDELVLCDDGSSDDTVGIAEAFERTAPFPVRVFRANENLGVVRNFEKAISLCEGDVIFLSDQDDVWLPTKVSRVLAAFAGRPDAQVVTHDETLADEDLRPLGVTKLQSLRALGLSEDSMMTGCCTALTRRWRDVCLPFPADIKAHDLWIGNLALALDARLLLKEPLIFYRRHGGNVTSSLENRGRVTAARLIGKLIRRDNPLDGWSKDLDLLSELEYRLRELSLRPELGIELNAGKMDDINAHRSALQRRLAALRAPRWVRPYTLLRNWLNGDYRYFVGLKSFIKDLVR